MNPCACMGPIGSDSYCPCAMRAKGLEPTRIWTAEARAELEAAFRQLADEENALMEPVK